LKNRQKLLGLLVAGVIALTGCNQAANEPPPEEEEEQQVGSTDYEGTDSIELDYDGHKTHTPVSIAGGRSKLTTSASKGLGSSAKGSASS